MANTVSQMVLDKTSENPGKIAYYRRDNGRFVSVTRQEMDEQVRAVGAWMRQKGVKPGQKISIFAETSPEWFVCDVASFMFGAIAVGIYANLTADVAGYILEHSESQGVFCETDVQIKKVLAEKDKCPELKWVVSFNPTKLADGKFIFNYADVLKEGAALDAKNPDTFVKLAQAVKPEELFTLVYTSGTTGMPKGVVLTHEAMMFVIDQSAKVVGLSENDVSTSFLPLSHILQRMVQYLGVAMGSVGYFTTIPTVIDDLQIIKPTVLASVPRIFEKAYQRVLQQVEQGSPIKKKIFELAMDIGRQRSKAIREKKTIPPHVALLFPLFDKLVFKKIKDRFGGRVRFFTSGGAPLSLELQEFFHAMDILILEGYGLSETSAPATINTLTDYKFGTVGKPLPEVEIKIAADGEILIRGKGNLKEYYKNPEATAEAIDKDGWFHSGDVGVLDREGYLKITDRKKDLIITSAGKNIAPQNIENHFKAHPLIGNFMVVGDRRNYLVGLVTLDPDTIGDWAKAHGLGGLDMAALAQHPKLHAAMEAAMAERNAGLARFETIKKFKILGDDFTVDNGLITPSLKLKRKVITERFIDDIESLYGAEA